MFALFNSVPPTELVVSEAAFRNAAPLSAIVLAEVSTKLSFAVFAFNPPALSIWILPTPVENWIVCPAPAALTVPSLLNNRLPADRSTKIPPVPAVKFIVPVPGFTSSGFTPVPMLLPATTVIVPLLALVLMSVPAVPLVTAPAAVRLALPAVSVFAPLKLMLLAPPVATNVATPVPPAVTAEPIVNTPVVAVRSTLPLAAVLMVPEVVKLPVLLTLMLPPPVWLMPLTVSVPAVLTSCTFPLVVFVALKPVTV